MTPCVFRRPGRALQGRNHQLHSRRRRGGPVRAGRLERPVPRAPRAEHRPAEGVQVDQAGRCLLAWRLEQRDAAADLRHRVGRQEGPEGLPAPAGGGRESGTTAASARSWISSISRKRPRAWCSGTTRAGGFTRSSQDYIRERLAENGYEEVNTPQIVDRSLWERSGHWDKFRENMFTTGDEDHRVYAVKPMNCPCHIQIYNRSLHSYRDLPLRMAEFGSCHRNEPSGTLHGLMRVRGFRAGRCPHLLHRRPGAGRVQ